MSDEQPTPDSPLPPAAPDEQAVIGQLQPGEPAEIAAEKAVKIQRFPVMEIFGPTLQGEGQMIGRQTMFIRFGGCDYRCKMCDSLHAVIPAEIKKGARWLTAKEICDELLQKRKHCDVVTFSGGNPCMWELTELCILLKEHKIKIAVETQGTIFQSWLMYAHWITVSPKGPGMGEKFEPEKFSAFGRAVMMYHQPQFISVKVVLFDQRDIEFAKEIAYMTQGGVPIYLSLGNPFPPNNPNGVPPVAMMGDLTGTLLHRMRVLFEDIQNEPTLKDAIFTPQMHVLLWGNELGR